MKEQWTTWMNRRGIPGRVRTIVLLLLVQACLYLLGGYLRGLLFTALEVAFLLRLLPFFEKASFQRVFSIRVIGWLRLVAAVVTVLMVTGISSFGVFVSLGFNRFVTPYAGAHLVEVVWVYFWAKNARHTGYKGYKGYFFWLLFIRH